MAIQIITSAGGNAGADSVSIPLTDLTGFGLTSAELTDNALGKARGKWAIFKRLQSVLSAASGLLGLSVPANPAFSTPSVNRVTYAYSLTSQFLVDKVEGTLSIVPLPDGGANDGVGGIAIADIFPGASKVSASASISGAAILIPTADLILQDANLSHSGLNLATGQDNRGEIFSLFNALIAESSTRSGTLASAFTSRSFGSLTSATIPAAYIAQTDPTSGIDPDFVTSGSVALLSQTASISVEASISVTGDTIDVNVITSA